MKDLNKFKEEMLEDFRKSNPFGVVGDNESFNAGWDACVKCLKASPTVTIEERKSWYWKIEEDKFKQEVSQIADEINLNNPETFDSFISYWTEPNKSKTKMRFELEKTWDTKRRLQTWIRNDKKFNPKETVGGKKEVVRMEGNYLKSSHFRK